MKSSPNHQPSNPSANHQPTQGPSFLFLGRGKIWAATASKPLLLWDSWGCSLNRTAAWAGRPTSEPIENKRNQVSWGLATLWHWMSACHPASCSTWLFPSAASMYGNVDAWTEQHLKLQHSHKGWNKQSCTKCYHCLLYSLFIVGCGWILHIINRHLDRGLTLVPNQQWVALWKVPAASFALCATLNTVSEMYNVASIEHR